MKYYNSCLIEGVTRDVEKGFFNCLLDNLIIKVYHDSTAEIKNGQTLRIVGKLSGFGNSIYLQAENIDIIKH